MAGMAGMAGMQGKVGLGSGTNYTFHSLTFPFLSPSRSGAARFSLRDSVLPWKLQHPGKQSEADGNGWGGRGQCTLRSAGEHSWTQRQNVGHHTGKQHG